MNKKTEQKLEELQAKPFYYYTGKEKTVSVCLLLRDGEAVARGVSICSPWDQNVRRIGRMKALGLALRALTKWENSGEVIPERFSRAHPVWDVPFRYRATFMPDLTWMERTLLERFGKKVEPTLEGRYLSCDTPHLRRYPGCFEECGHSFCIGKEE